MLSHTCKKYYLDGYNCAEAIIHGGNDYYDLKLSNHDMRMVAAFGGGMQLGDVCGALTSACCIISAKYIENKAHDQKEELAKITRKMVIAFQKRMGSRLCAQIKPVFHQKETRCLNTVLAACEVIEEVINDYEAEILRNN